ncbi:MAG: hypothetical protein NTX61_06235 [Bacteroidetes bacterium]|nr:hypothetical protein [Bacteroidota bacterium]
MIIHLDSDNPKPIEQKVQELILKKLFIKVDDDKIFINKEDFISLILKDVIAIAKADFDLDKALKIALDEQEAYRSFPDKKKKELEDASLEFQVEIEAYQAYLTDKKDRMTDDEIYMEVLLTLNSETEFLDRKLHELMMDALGQKMPEDETPPFGLDRWSLLDNFAYYIKFIASNETIDEAVEEMHIDMEIYPERYLVKKESVKKELERIAHLPKMKLMPIKWLYQWTLKMQSIL